jgi:hypothetical protein
LLTLQQDAEAEDDEEEDTQQSSVDSYTGVSIKVESNFLSMKPDSQFTTGIIQFQG